MVDVTADHGLDQQPSFSIIKWFVDLLALLSTIPSSHILQTTHVAIGHDVSYSSVMACDLSPTRHK